MGRVVAEMGVGRVDGEGSGDRDTVEDGVMEGVAVEDIVLENENQGVSVADGVRLSVGGTQEVNKMLAE